jgi:3-hydroxy-3-methylglutaryl CoA synthase
MNRVLMVVAAMCFVDSVRAQDGLSVVGSDYFPIAVGSRWEYTAGVGSSAVKSSSMNRSAV